MSYKLESVGSDPLHRSTHNAGFLITYVASIQGLRDLDNQHAWLAATQHKEIVLTPNPHRFLAQPDQRVYVPIHVPRDRDRDR